MPRCVRPCWVHLDVTGRKSTIATGPRRRDGGITATFHVREHGSIKHGALSVHIYGSEDKKTVTVRILDEYNRAIYSRTYDQDTPRLRYDG